MICGVMPRRDAVSRSMTELQSRARRSAGRWPRRAARGSCCSLSTRRGDQIVSSLASASSRRVLILRAADAVFDGQVLHRLHVERDAGDLRQLRLQAADDFGGACCRARRAASG